MAAYRCVATLFMLCLALATTKDARAVVIVAGVPIEETATVGGVVLPLNGAGFRKRGYFKVDVTALYTQRKVATIDALETSAGPKRLMLTMQQEITGSQASRYFLIDFEASASPAEFAQLINEVATIGDLYSALPRLRKGDVVTMDWIPGKGILAALNGNVLTPHGAGSPYIDSELMSKIMLRMYVAGKTPVELRENLLGASSSMRDRP